MRVRFAPSVLLAAAIYLVLTLALTWPLIRHPGSVVPSDLGDPLLNTWLMAWNARVMPLTAAWWNAPQFFPVRGVTAFSEHLLGLSVITFPIIAATGNALLAYNAAFLLTFPLSAWSAWYLVYVLTGRRDAAFVAGLAFGFAPYRMAQFAHVQVLSAYWMPLALAGLHRYLQDRRARWLVLFAGAWLMQALTCGYYFFYLSVLIVFWLAWFVAGRRAWHDLVRIAIAWGAAALLLAPVLDGYWRFQHAYGLRRDLEEITTFSADVASVLKAPGNLRLWGALDVVDRPEASLFPGFVIVLMVVAGLVLAWHRAARMPTGRLKTARVLGGLALVFVAAAVSPLVFGPWKIGVGGLRLLSVATPHKPLSIALLLLAAAAAFHPSARTVWQRRSPLAFYAAAAVAMWMFSLGPAPTLMDKPFIDRGPYAWLMMLPGLDGVRVPARFWMLAALCLAVACGLAVRHLAARWPRIGNTLPALVSIALLCEAWPQPITMQTPPDFRPSHSRTVARLDLPMEPNADAIALYRSIEHQRPLFNGYSGYFARHYWAMQYLLEQHDPAVLTRLSGFGAFEVVIDHDLDGDGASRRFVGGYPQAQQVYSDSRYTSYRIERGPRVAPLARVPGTPLGIASIQTTLNPGAAAAMTDGNLVSRWDGLREQRPGDRMTVDLGSPHEVRGAEMLIAEYAADFPRQLLIETSLDGGSWAPAWSGGTGVMAISAAIDDPLDVTLPFSFEPRSARFVRFTQTGADRVYYWSVAELRVIGP